MNGNIDIVFLAMQCICENGGGRIILHLSRRKRGIPVLMPTHISKEVNYSNNRAKFAVAMRRYIILIIQNL